jgi:hypothetical protein
MHTSRRPHQPRAHARSCDEAVLASLTWICDAEQLYTDAALVLDTSTRIAAAARSGLIDLHFALRCRPCGRVSGRPQRAHVRCCDEAVLASLTWICDAEQLYTDAALVLDTSTRIAAAARSGLIDLRFAPPLFDVSHFSGRLFFRP